MLASDTRGRLTILDVLLLLVAVAMIGSLWPIVRAGMDANAGALSTGEELLFQMILAVMLLVVLTTIWRRAIRGAV